MCGNLVSTNKYILEESCDSRSPAYTKSKLQQLSTHKQSCSFSSKMNSPFGTEGEKLTGQNFFGAGIIRRLSKPNSCNFTDTLCILATIFPQRNRRARRLRHLPFCACKSNTFFIHCLNQITLKIQGARSIHHTGVLGQVQ